VRKVLVLLLALRLISVVATGQAAKPGDSAKARVFITDSQSWEIAGYGGGGPGGGGSATRGGACPQTAEIIKTFGERCPEVMVNNIQEKTDYIVVLDHEGGKGVLRHRNKVAVLARISGDSVVSKSTLSLGGSVQEACDAINRDWVEHGEALRAAATLAAQNKAAAAQSAVVAPIAAPVVPAAPVSGKLSVASTPDGADIEVDGSFVGNTPSEVQLAEGEHTVAVKKAGFKDWERKLKVTGGSIHLSAELEKLATQ
jgi:hypothetical protein